MTNPSHLEIPFDFNIETIRWKFPNGDSITIEKNVSGYFLSGIVGGKDWHDEDHEDFFFSSTDEFLDFLAQHGLLGALSVRTVEKE